MRTRVRAGDSSAFAELFDQLRPRGLQPRLPADRRLVDRRGRDGRDLPGGLAAARAGRPRGRLAAALAAGHRHQHRAQPAPQQPPLPGRRDAAAAAEFAVPDHADEVAGRLDDRRRIAAALTALATLRRPNARSSRCAWARAWTTRPRRRRSASRSAPSPPGCPGPARSCASSPRPNGRPPGSQVGVGDRASDRVGDGDSAQESSREAGRRPPRPTDKRRSHKRDPARTGRKPMNANTSRQNPAEWDESAQLLPGRRGTCRRAVTSSTRSV